MFVSHTNYWKLSARSDDRSRRIRQTALNEHSIVVALASYDRSALCLLSLCSLRVDHHRSVSVLRTRAAQWAVCQLLNNVWDWGDSRAFNNLFLENPTTTHRGILISCRWYWWCWMNGPACHAPTSTVLGGKRGANSVQFISAYGTCGFSQQQQQAALLFVVSGLYLCHNVSVRNY